VHSCKTLGTNAYLPEWIIRARPTFSAIEARFRTIWGDVVAILDFAVLASPLARTVTRKGSVRIQSDRLEESIVIR
jgi:hypothetical protein